MTIIYLWSTRSGVNCDMYKKSKGSLLGLFKQLCGETVESGLLVVALIIMVKILDFRNDVANLVVSSLSTALFLYIGWICLRNWLETITDFMRGENVSFLRGVFRPGKMAEKWAIALGWWIPRKYRGAIVGDILEDCHEMRETGCREWRIRIQVIWQWAISIVILIPAAVFGSILRIFSPTK